MKKPGFKALMFYAVLIAVIVLLIWPQETGSLISKIFTYVKDFSVSDGEAEEEVEQSQDA